MTKKFKTNIEIISPAANKEEAIEILGDYLSGNIASGIDMKYTTKVVHFYDNSAVKFAALVLLIFSGFFVTAKTMPQYSFGSAACQMAAIQPPLRTITASVTDSKFRNEWTQERNREALDIIKK